MENKTITLDELTRYIKKFRKENAQTPSKINDDFSNLLTKIQTQPQIKETKEFMTYSYPKERYIFQIQHNNIGVLYFVKTPPSKLIDSNGSITFGIENGESDWLLDFSLKTLTNTNHRIINEHYQLIEQTYDKEGDLKLITTHLHAMDENGLSYFRAFIPPLRTTEYLDGNENSKIEKVPIEIKYTNKDNVIITESGNFRHSTPKKTQNFEAYVSSFIKEINK